MMNMLNIDFIAMPCPTNIKHPTSMVPNMFKISKKPKQILGREKLGVFNIGGLDYYGQTGW